MPFVETAAFLLTARGYGFDRSRVEVGNGTNSFTNNTALPSVALGGTGFDIFWLGGVGMDDGDNNNSGIPDENEDILVG